MKILLDECLPRPLKADLVSFVPEVLDVLPKIQPSEMVKIEAK